MSLRLTALHAVMWNFTEQLASRGIAGLTTLLLSYFLAPEDFGIIAILALFLALGSGLMDCGIKEALIRRRRLSQNMLDSALFGSLLTGLLVYLGMCLLASPVALFFDQPRLQELIPVVSLAILINALQSTPSARLANTLNFRTLMFASTPAVLISSILALSLAWAGAGVWALIAQMLSTAFVRCVLLWWHAGWRPSLQIQFRLLAGLYRFGYKLFLSGLIAIVIRNAVPSLIGKSLGPAAAGYYYFVDKIMEMVMGQLVYSVQNVTYPTFSRLSHNKTILREAYRKVLELSVFLVSPILAIAAGLAEPLFAFIFAEKWLPAVNVFRWLCISYVMYPLHATNLNIVKVMGRTDIFLGLECLKATIALTILLWCLPQGLQMVLMGQVIVTLLCYVPNSFYSSQLVDYPIVRQISDVAPYIIAAALSGFFAYGLTQASAALPHLVQLFLASSSASVVYLLLCHIAHRRAAGLLVELFKERLRL